MWLRETQARATADEAPPSLPTLFRDAADSFVELIAAHIKLTNLELVADLEARTRHVAYQLAVCVIGLVGYVLLMVGLALVAAPLFGRALAFSLLGALHLAAAGISALVLSRRRQQSLQVERALHSVGKSMTVVADAVLGSPEQPHAGN
jgi:hypothetical protein